MHALLVAAAVAVVVTRNEPNGPPGDAAAAVEVVHERLGAVLRADERAGVERVAATADGAERDGGRGDADVRCGVAWRSRRGDPGARTDGGHVDLPGHRRGGGRGAGLW